MKENPHEKKTIIPKNCGTSKVDEKICNPLTGRYIKPEGLIHRRLLKAKIIDKKRTVFD
jgi:hypothetical protein